MTAGYIRVVNPNGYSLVVDITTPTRTPTAYTDATLGSTVSLPATVDESTSFYIPDHDVYTVSVKANGVELAGNTVRLEDGQSLIIAPSIDPGVDLSGTLALVNSPERVYIPADSLTAAGGSPVLSVVNHHNIFALDAASAEWVSAGVQVPKDWTSADVVLVWTNLSSGSGNVVWQAGVSVEMEDGDTVTAPTMATKVTVAAPAQDVVKRTTVATGLALTAENLAELAIERLAADAGDTLANDAGVIGVILERVV